MGRFVGRIHAIGAIARFEHRQTISVGRMGKEASDYVLESTGFPSTSWIVIALSRASYLSL